MSKRFLVVILFLSSLLGMAFSSPKAYSEENKEERALFILNSTERDAVREAILQIRSQGGRISITSPPALLGYIPKDKADELVGEFGIIGIYFDEIDIASIEKHGEAVVSEARIWNRRLAKEKQEQIQGVTSEEGRGLPPKNDILVDTTDYPIPDYILKRKQLQGQTLRPGYYFTSEYMVGEPNKGRGNISVIVVYVESNGAPGCHQSIYDWTDDEKEDVKGQVEDALWWWSSVAFSNGVTLNFDVDFYTAETCYEPITMPLESGHKLWVPGVIDYLRREEVDFHFCPGIADAPDNHYDKTLAACNCIREYPLQI